MKNKIRNRFISSTSIFVITLIIFGSGFFAGRITSPLSSKSIATKTGITPQTFQPYIQAWNILNKNYIDQPIDSELLVQGSIRGMLDELGDPYTNYIDPETFAQENASLDGEYTGIGAWVDTSGENLVIISPMPDSPAEEAGLQPGDVVVAVDGKSMENIDPSIVLEHILGPEDTPITLTIARQGSSDLLEFELVRRVIPLPSVESEIINENIGYIQIFSFANKTYNDIEETITEFLKTGVSYLIIDLRNNPGGLVDSAIDITSLFIEEKVVLIEEWGDGSTNEYTTTIEPIALDIPLYILVNQGTASASEIIAGALQDHDRAILIGNTTFGKGLIQNWIPLNGDNGAVRITIAKWLTPKGRQIQGAGLYPDHIVEFTIEDFDAGNDPQLEKALVLIKENK